MSGKIEIKIIGPKLTPDKFEKAVKEFFALVEGVAKNLAENAKSEDWTVEVSHGSSIVRVMSQIAERGTAIDAVTHGLRSLASGVQTIPRWFTKEEIRAARNLTALIDGDGKFIKEIQIQNGDSPILLSYEIVKTADAILSGEKQIAFGSIEGTIESFHRKDGQPFTCSIHDPVHRRSIVCSFTNVDAEEIAYRAFRPPKRVMASGLIHYAKEGNPVRIDVNLVRVFPDEENLPTLDDIHAFFKK